MDEMCCGPFDKTLCVISDRNGRRIVHMLEDRIEHRSRVPAQLSHELTGSAVEVAEK
jgi:hypothetical protein